MITLLYELYVDVAMPLYSYVGGCLGTFYQLLCLTVIGNLMATSLRSVLPAGWQSDAGKGVVISPDQVLLL